MLLKTVKEEGIIKSKLLILTILTSVVLFAGDNLLVNNPDGSWQDFDINKISNLTFSEIEGSKIRINKKDGTELMFDLSKISDLTFAETTDIEKDDILKKMSISLLRSYPNPFNPAITINFESKKEGFTRVDIFNYLGQIVTTLYNGNLNSGSHSMQWNAQDKRVSTGSYFVKVSQNGEVVCNKILLLK